MNPYRLLFLGAGFSKLAGLPVGNELLPLLRTHTRRQYGGDNQLEHDLERFVTFRDRCSGERTDPNLVDFEEFLGYLDTEHYLGLEGSDTWSTEGNQGQLLARMSIAQLLFERSPRSAAELPEAYKVFVRHLRPKDVIYTFNYDTLLEMALDDAEIPYRLFPHRYSRVGMQSALIEDNNEVVVLKLHGSIDWFSKIGFNELVDDVVAQGGNLESAVLRCPIFGRDALVTPEPLVEGPRFENDPLKQIWRVRDLSQIIDQHYIRCSPYLLSPSTTKLYYASPLLEFWRGMNRGGVLNFSFGIVGYSLPQHDDHGLQVIYETSTNFQYAEQNFTFDGRTKAPLRIIDFQESEEAIAAFKERYRFLDWTRVEARFNGFNEENADWIMQESLVET
jgi:hypothetical protein